MCSKPSTKQLLQLWHQIVSGGHSIRAICSTCFCNVVMLPIVPLSPDEIDGDLKDQSQPDKCNSIICTCLKAHDSDVPVRVSHNTKQIPCYFEPQRKGIRAGEEETISSLIWLTTIETALRTAPLIGMLTSRKSRNANHVIKAYRRTR
ncbi:hypothetical protein F2Q69_00040168 [Brassica cretica]|uniref:Uncharacterized protein n=1 Tax=Brassica cretica TaxID=69181 RepID=A0A8S9NHK7_BRACR|nr:hypothetical protein F2Q69_00040168 [Brassica cretica]